MRSGIVYTETVIYSPPVAFLADAPYQTAIGGSGATCVVSVLGAA